MKPISEFISLVALMSALPTQAQSEEIQFETDGFRGEVANGLTSNRPFLRLYVEPRKQSQSRTVPFVAGQLIESSESVLRTVRPSEFRAKKWPRERPIAYEVRCLPFKRFIRLDEFGTDGNDAEVCF